MPAFRSGRKGSGLVMPGLLLEIVVSAPPSSCGAFEHIEQIESQPSLVSAAAVLAFDGNHQCTEARVALGSFADMPCRVPQLESYLQGKVLTPEVIESAGSTGWDRLRPLTDAQASGGYRQSIAPVLIRRLLRRCSKET
jgi:CO/xanthine dehydrogenase FAD-binding subunit